MIWGSEVFPKFRRSLWPNGEITGVGMHVPRSKPGKATLFLTTVCFTIQENVIAMLCCCCCSVGRHILNHLHALCAWLAKLFWRKEGVCLFNGSSEAKHNKHEQHMFGHMVSIYAVLPSNCVVGLRIYCPIFCVLLRPVLSKTS